MNYKDPSESEIKYIRKLTPSVLYRICETSATALIITVLLAVILYFVLLLFFRNIPNQDRLTLILVASCIGFIAIMIRVFLILKSRDKQLILLRDGHFDIIHAEFHFVVDTSRVSVHTSLGNRIITYDGTIAGLNVETLKRGTPVIVCKLKTNNKVFIAIDEVKEDARESTAEPTTTESNPT